MLKANKGTLKKSISMLTVCENQVISAVSGNPDGDKLHD